MRRRVLPAAAAGRLLVLGCGVLHSLLATSDPVAAGKKTQAAQLLVRLPDPATSALVHRSLRGAISRLDRSQECRALLTDFAAPAGESLAAVLEARDETPGEYMAGLLFLDGASHPRCRSGKILAFTAPGWRVVYVCAGAFRQHLERSPAEAEAVLIHEALHTMGLGENPPSPQAIQNRVIARCGGYR